MWVPVLKQVKRVLPGKTFWTLAVRMSAHVTVAPTSTSTQFAVDSSDESIQVFKQPTWYSTPLQRMSRIDFNPSQDLFKLKDVAFSYLCDLESKIERIRKVCEDKDDEDYCLTLIDSLEKTSAILDPLL